MDERSPSPGTVPKDSPKPNPKSNEAKPGTFDKAGEWLIGRVTSIWENMQEGHLWQRMLKNTLATTIAIILALIPAVVGVYGKASYLAAVTTVFGHPGRRFGQMAEGLVLTILGALLGTGWSVLGVYLSSLVYDSNSPAAYTIKGIFLTIAVLFHGYLRSHTPRLFLFVLILIIVTVVSLTGTSTSVSAVLVTTILYPILTAVGILLVVNVAVFPEFSSDFLGITTIQTLSQTVDALRDANIYFVSTIGPEEEQSEKPDDEHSSEEPDRTAEEALEKPEERPANHLLRRLLGSIKSKVSNQNPADPTQETAEKSHTPKVVGLKSLTDQKAKLRAKLGSCKAAQQECMFELAFAVLPPRDLKPISDTAMKKLVANTISLIGACESKYALLGDRDDLKRAKPTANTETPDEIRIRSRRSSINHDSEAGDTSYDEQSNKRGELNKMKKGHKKKKNKNKNKARLEKKKEDLEMVKPHKEIESADEELLRRLLKRINGPLQTLQHNIDKSVEVITSCLAYCYDVPKLPSGALPPKGIKLEELDIHIDAMKASMIDFDKNSSAALETATALYNIESLQVDIMPRMETFLISSFLLNLRQAAAHTREMLKHSRKLVEKRQARHDRRKLWAPRINWRKWLTTGGEQDFLSLPDQGRKDKRLGKTEEQDDPHELTETRVKQSKTKDLESGGETEPTLQRPKTKKVKPKKCQEKGRIARLRIKLDDFIDATLHSDDVEYAIKLAVAVLLVTWPSFLGQWNAWYSANRGLWAALQLVLITEVAIGASIGIFLLRVVGTTIGCCWGLISFEAARGSRVVAVVMLVIGILPSTYIQLGTKYIKAGMVCIISMCIVVLATVDITVAGSATDNFLKRLIAFLIGGFVALLVEFVVLPVKARDRLVESLAAAINKITEMEACLAHGIESGKNTDARSPELVERFERALSKAQGALAAAETFLQFSAHEPRLKGSFAGVALVYEEVLYVLHHIIERMDNMLHLRKEYGGVLEEYNEEIYAYRRNLAGSITLILFAVHEALTTKLPLPQFLPSARLAHLRVVNKVRELVLENEPGLSGGAVISERSQLEISMVRRMVGHKFMSWNAASAGQIEVIEYLEELIDLTKLLVGANEFRSGLLTRPTYREYVTRIKNHSQENGKDNLEVNRVRRSTVPGPFPVPNKLDSGQEQAEMADTVPEELAPGKSKTRRMSRLFGANGDEAGRGRKGSDPSIAEQVSSKLTDDNELPLSLQRVRSKRIEERKLEKVRSKQSMEEQDKGERS